MSKIYYYKFGHEDWEEGDFITLSHQTCYTQDEFRQFIHEASLYILNNFEQYNGEWNNLIVWIDDKTGKRINTTTFRDLQIEVLNILVKEHGFVQIPYTVKWVARSSSDLFAKDESSYDTISLQKYLAAKKCRVGKIEQMTNEEVLNLSERDEKA